MGDAIEPVERLSVEPTFRLELGRLTRDPHRLPIGRKGSQRPSATLPRQQPPPTGRQIRPQRRHSAQTGDDHASLLAAHRLHPKPARASHA